MSDKNRRISRDKKHISSRFSVDNALSNVFVGITNSADCLGYCVMTGLLWPNRAGQYLLLASTKYSGK